MSIERYIEGENKSIIEQNWTIFTETFNIDAGKKNNITSDNIVKFDNPEINEEEENEFFKDGYWSSDKNGNNRITEAHIGEKVFFILEMKKMTEKKSVSVQLYDYDEGFKDDPIDVVKINDDGTKGGLIRSWNLPNNKGSQPIYLAPGLESFAENSNNDEIHLYYKFIYEGYPIDLPRNKEDYLLVKTCDKKVVKNYNAAGEYGDIAFYKFRYDDFMRRHEKCGHVPPTYYYGPMLKINKKTEKFHNAHALTKEMVKHEGLSLSTIKLQKRLEEDAKPMPAFSYGYKYVVRFTHKLQPELTSKGKDWLTKARKNLQILIDRGLIDKNYEAQYDTITEKFTSLTDIYNRNFIPTKEELQVVNNQYEIAKNDKMEKFYSNIELINERFQEFAFATHPEAYNPKAMSELTVKDLALIMLTPDFKEWIGEGTAATWIQAGLVAANMEYDALLNENIDYYILDDHFEPDDDFLDYLDDIGEIVYKIMDEAFDVLRETGDKVKREAVDLLLYFMQVKKYIKQNSIRNGE